MLKIERNSLLLVACFAVAFSSPISAQLNDGVPKEVQDVGIDQNLGGKLPLDVLVTDDGGRKVRLGDLVGGDLPYLFTLNYSDCPMLCSVQLSQLVQTLDGLDLKIGKDFELVTLSIDPNETTEKVRSTKKKYVDLLPNQAGAESGWHFATAGSSEIRQVASSLGFRFRYDKLTKEYYHPAMLAFITPEGIIARYSLEVAFPEDQMRIALVEASNGQVGTVVDQFLLLCFQYDANRNRYVASAWKIMRLGGLITVGLLLVTLTPFWLGKKYAAGLEGSADVENQTNDIDKRIGMPLAPENVGIERH